VLLSQRQSSSKSSADEAGAQWRNTMAGSGAAALAFGSIAWYYYQFGRDVHAMTPAEEG